LGTIGERTLVRLFVLIVGLAVALLIPAAARGGEQAFLSWAIDDQNGKPTVTWEITGSTKWYVGVIQIATDRQVNAKGDFRAENLVVYDVLDPSESTGTWVWARKLGPGTYFGRLKLRYDGPCKKNCQSTTSIRSFTIDPPPLKSLTWSVSAGVGTVKVSWTKPKNGWFVGMVIVDDNLNFGSPEDASVWSKPPKATRWTSGLLARDTYHVRIRARHSSCDSCIWTSATKTVRVAKTNSPPQLHPARIEITRRDEQTDRHWWNATFKACDQTPGKLRVQAHEATGPAGGSVANERTTTRLLLPPDGCRTYTLTKQSAFPLSPGTFVRVAIRVQDAAGAWSVRTRKVTWVTTA
jgi:hypothetical protein